MDEIEEVEKQLEEITNTFSTVDAYRLFFDVAIA
jgi:hypothetical protein